LIYFFSSSSNDLAWDGESKRIIAVGDGKEKSVQPFTSDFWCDTTIIKTLFSVETRFGHAFLMDTGSSTGEILGHSKVSYIQSFSDVHLDFTPLLITSKVVNAVSIRHQRPFRSATAGDDSSIIFYTGAPYKYEKVNYSQSPFFLVYLRISSCRRSTRTVNSFKM
jgi:hypothetical protein